jgi:sulfoxide reductase heme-binding subunit YedZ
MKKKWPHFIKEWIWQRIIKIMVVDRINQAAGRIPNWSAYILLLLPAPWLFYLGLTGGLGVEPINALEREYGELALKLIVLGLCITPARRFLGLNFLKFRRAIGIASFIYVTLHLLVWMILDVQSPSQIWSDIVKRPYVTVGMLGFVLMIPLALTSNNWSVRKLGQKWRALHRLTYSIAVLGALHFVWLSKGFQFEPLLYLFLVLILLGVRFFFGKGFRFFPV